LSGGVDSGNILAASEEMRQDIGQDTIRTFSSIHSAEHLDEEKNIVEILRGFPRVRSDFISTAGAATYEDFQAFLRMHDEPMSSDGIFNQYWFMKQVNKIGMKVMLSGQGADELFLGYPWYIKPYIKWLLCNYKLSSAWKWIREFQGREGFKIIPLLRDIASELSRKSSYEYKQNRVSYWLKKSAWDDYCSEKFKSDLDLMKNWSTYHLSQLFEKSLLGLLKDEDRNSMGNGIETRLPYLDFHIVEWALKLSPDVNFQMGLTKYAVRTAFVDRLPQRIITDKNKRGFYVPFLNRWDEHKNHFIKAITETDCLNELIKVSDFLSLAGSGRLDYQLKWRCFNLAFAYQTAVERFINIGNMDTIK